MNLKVLNIVTCLFIAAFIATSCLDDEEYDYEYSANASITAFSIGDIETEFETTVDGVDTTLTATVTGTDYPFVIDQLQGLIYNVDSLPVGTDVSKVVVDISADGYVFIVAETDSIWEETDSLNFENPIQFKVMAYNGNYGRVYTAKVNVHQQDPEVMSWTKVSGNFSTSIQKQKAVWFKEQIIVFAEQEEQVAVTVAQQADASTWTALQPLTGIPVKADYSSVIVWGEALYILADNDLYTSLNGIDWAKADTEQKLASLTASISLNADTKLMGITTDNFYAETTDGSTWSTYAEMPSDFPQVPSSYAAYPLATNNSINRIVLLGQSDVAGDSTNNVWTQLAYEHEWTPLNMEENKHALPNMENTGMIYYNNRLYAFGGPGKNGSSVTAFEYMYVSNDNGIGWEKQTEKVLFPEDFATLYDEAGGNYSYTVDSDHFLWVMWGKTGEVWRGRINKLGFVNQ